MLDIMKDEMKRDNLKFTVAELSIDDVTSMLEANGWVSEN